MAGAVAILPAILSATATAAGAAMTVAQANQQAGTARVQAAQARLSAEQAQLAAEGEQVRGQAAALDVRDQLLRTLASQRARYAAGGLSLDSGTPATLAEETAAVADRQLDIIGTQTRINAAARRMGAASAGIRAGLLDDQADSLTTAAPIAAGLDLARGGMNLFDAVATGTTRPPRPRRAPAGELDGMF